MSPRSKDFDLHELSLSLFTIIAITFQLQETRTDLHMLSKTEREDLKRSTQTSIVRPTPRLGLHANSRID